MRVARAAGGRGAAASRGTYQASRRMRHATRDERRATGHRQSAIGNRQSAIGHRQSAIGNERRAQRAVGARPRRFRSNRVDLRQRPRAAAA
ncbi:AraC family transcriptional regulator [Burkholderia pseudomallei]|nr:AraC family transcriptional regulator [Burkholderia pseudomallei]OMT24266.1 AraC family transcriptional regulator [Burkholderia pseudomallei]OMT33829.1 AraC family transcriptional regulator [Burkholderia pseudomallei]OMV35300.1 AraC family transcriptional regulator [Burkholderia pseudomallei]OMV39283.1 AraC family transcriptional regulator [Burkholderia pseudomallei]